MKRIALVVCLFVGACDPSGRSCVTPGDCGDSNYTCVYPAPDRSDPALACSVRTGVCTRVETCAGPDGEWWDDGTNGCGCDGERHGTSFHCPDRPLLSIGGAVSCSCDNITPENPVHPGLRQPTEYCRGFSPDYWLPAHCCECVNVVPGPTPNPTSHACPTSDSRHVPNGCCNCFDATAPDPTGECVPPGGVYPPTGGYWCCPNTELIQTTTADAGVDAS